MQWTTPLIASEARLLLLSARTQAGDAVAKKIAEIASEPINWDSLLSLFARNSITPLLEMNFRKFAIGKIPPAQLDRLEERVRAITAHNLLLSGELVRVINVFRSEEILAIPYKGPVIAAQAYGNVALREFDDLDVIVRHSDISRVHNAMLSLGYRAKFPRDLLSRRSPLIPGEYKYYDETRNVLVELHTELTFRHFPIVPDFERLSRRAVPVCVAGHTLSTFSPEDALTVLSIHGSKDFWERISWIADLSELINSNHQLDWETAFQLAESLKAQRMLCLGLILASNLLESRLPLEIDCRIRKDSTAVSLASEIAPRLMGLHWTDLDAGARFRFRRSMLPGLEGWRYALRLSLAPAEDDWFAFTLPRALAPAYALLRPLRLLRRYGWRGRGPNPKPPVL